MDVRNIKIRKMKIEKNQEEQVVNFGAFGYDSEKIASILGVEKREVDIAMSDNNSTLNKLLLKGKNMADYVIDLKLFDLAKTGDLKALAKFESRKKARG